MSADKMMNRAGKIKIFFAALKIIILLIAVPPF